jgi:hypothetical protein
MVMTSTCPRSEYFGMTQKKKQEAIQDKRRIKALKTPPASDVPNPASKRTSIGDGFFMQKQQHQATVLTTATGKDVVLVTTTTIIPPCTTNYYRRHDYY